MPKTSSESLTPGLKLAQPPADVACPERRQAIRSLLLLPALIPTLANAVDDPSPLLKVTTQLNSGASIQDIDLSKCALYITARPNTADNVPRAILDGSRGKPPPVLIARIANFDEFPVEYTLTSQDVTVEGQGNWWQNDGLVVSARLDSDGVAATRDPNDLVGRTLVAGGETSAKVELQGRGAAGKFFTSKSS